MRTGTIESEPTLDWEGDTLVVDADTGDTVLSVDSAIDFDDDDSRTRWLVVADSEPLEYVAVDRDANTVTLASPLAADYEADLPVIMWDPTAGSAGAKVQEYRAQVVLADGTGTMTATIPHTLIPLNGVANLVGASVGVDERRGEWYVDEVFAREANVSAASVDTPYMRAYLSSDIIVASGVERTVDGWSVVASHPSVTLSDDPLVDSAFIVTDPGVYLVICTIGFQSDGAGTGARNAYIQLFEPGAPPVITTVGEVTYGTGSGGSSQIQVVGTVVITEPTQTRIMCSAKQSSGVDLAVQADGATGTRVEIVRVA